MATTQDALTYGSNAYEAITWVVGDDWLVSQLSLPTKVNVGAYLQAAYAVGEIIAAAESGAPIAQLFDAGMNIALDVIADVSSAALGMASFAVPLVGQAFSMLVDFVSSARERELERQRQRAILWAENCRAQMRAFEVHPTGTHGNAKPCDFFVEAYREGYDDSGEPVWIVGGRPFFGRMLQAITESQFNGMMLHGLGFNPPTVATGAMFGVPQAEFDLYNGKLAGDKVAPNWYPFCLPAEWPTTRQRYISRFRALRRAIELQSIAARQARGLAPGDGGTSLWPVYMDLLHSAIRRPQPPWGDESLIGAPGYSMVPPIGEAYLRTTWSGRYTPYIVERLIQWRDDYDARDRCTPSHPYNPQWDEVIALLGSVDYGGPCMGSPSAAIDGILELVDRWQDTVDPVYGDDIAKQAQDVRDAWAAIHGFTMQRLEGLGLVGGAKFGATIERLRGAGVVTEATSTEVAAKVPAASSGAPAAVAFAAAALGFALL